MRVIGRGRSAHDPLALQSNAPLSGSDGPAHHADSAAAVARDKVAPYVVAGDVYALPPHTGRGGRSWYTGSAGWMYQLLTESLLGLRRSGNTLRVSPLLPAHWNALDIQYRFSETHYNIHCCRSSD